MALFHRGVEALGRAPEPVRELPVLVQVGTWVLEALALSALYLLVQTSGGGRLLNGLLTGWIAWVFRGPLLVVSVVTIAGQSPGPWWSMAFAWFVLYTTCGLLLGVVAVAANLKPAPPQP
jgi:hypothetical protein